MSVSHKYRWDDDLRPNQNLLADGWVIDFEKGVMLDIKSMTEKQFSEYIRTTPCSSRIDLNFRQAMGFVQDYYGGEYYLFIKLRQYTCPDPETSTT
jgi:hypothetical protein